MAIRMSKCMYMPDRGILSCRDSARTLTTLQYAHEMPEHLKVRRSARERDSHSARGAREGCTPLREKTELVNGAEMQVAVQHVRLYSMQVFLVHQNSI